MSYARTIEAAAAAAFVLVLVPVAASSAPATEHAVAAPAPIVALPVVEAIEKIDGVRVIADTAHRIEMAGVAIEKFAAAGWEIENTEIRWSEDECDGAVGFHAEERGHHVVVMCTDAEWTLLHELGHVWSDLYLDDEARDEWLERRGLDSWHEGPYDERGTEQETHDHHHPEHPDREDRVVVGAREPVEWDTEQNGEHRCGPRVGEGEAQVIRDRGERARLRSDATQVTLRARQQPVPRRDNVPTAGGSE